MHIDVGGMMGRAGGLLRMMADAWLRGTIWRVVWSLPLARVLLIAGVIFALLVIFG